MRLKPKAAVVGWPISHSLSPQIFSSFSKSMGQNLDYQALSIKPQNFSVELAKASQGQWLGWNITLPHKIHALELSQKIDASAQEAGAVNVIRFQEGQIMGYNTDIEGFLAPILARKIELRNKRAVVFGGSGAARAVCAALKRQKLSDLTIINRTLSKAQELARIFDGIALNWGSENIKKSVAEADLVINASSLGLTGKGSPLPEQVIFKSDAWAYDLIYRPKVTLFLKIAQQSGANILGGLGMLIAQAAATWKIWFGQELPGLAIDKAHTELEEILK